MQYIWYCTSVKKITSQIISFSKRLIQSFLSAETFPGNCERTKELYPLVDHRNLVAVFISAPLKAPVLGQYFPAGYKLTFQFPTLPFHKSKLQETKHRLPSFPQFPLVSFNSQIHAETTEYAISFKYDTYVIFLIFMVPKMRLKCKQDCA